MAVRAKIKISKALYRPARVVTTASPTVAVFNTMVTCTAALKKQNSKLLKKLPDIVKTKIKNITGKARVASLCGGARIAKHSRFTIPYRQLGSVTLDDLRTINNGVVVVLENGDYFNIQHSSSPLDKYLLENIGGDKTVSAIVAFRSVGGTSSSAATMKIYEKMKPIIEEQKWIPVERISPATIPHGKTYIGNDKWKGHYYVNICGGSNKKKVQTHCAENGALPAKFQLFNCVGGYMNSAVGIHLTSSMLYMLLFSTDIISETDLKEDSLATFKKEYESLLAKVCYDSGSVLVWCNRFIRGGQLICPLDGTPIPFKYFNITASKDHNYMQLCHNEAASKKRYFQDQTINIFMGDHRPNNLFWGTHQGNMEQQDMTIEEYHYHLRTKVRRLNKLFPLDS